MRRQSYDLNEEEFFDVEYADVLGISLDFTACPVVAPPQPTRETVQVPGTGNASEIADTMAKRLQFMQIASSDRRGSAAYTV